VSAVRVLVGSATAGVVFAGVLAVTFPTDAVVRHALARVTPPAGSALFFGHAALRPWGFNLEQVALRRPDGTALATADWLVLRPSLVGFLHDGTGRPWHAHGRACGGAFEAVVERDGPGDALVLAWRDVDLGGCPVFAVAGERFVGRADGAATLREQSAVGDGTLRIRDGVWDGARRLVPGMDALHADTATVRWTLREATLGLTEIDLAAREIRMTGTGTVLLATPLELSAVDLGLTLAPGPGASGLLRRLLSMLPPSAMENPEARRFAVTGTIVAPRLAVSP
jgi:type II secretion system protein N